MREQLLYVQEREGKKSDYFTYYLKKHIGVLKASRLSKNKSFCSADEYEWLELKTL